MGLRVVLGDNTEYGERFLKAFQEGKYRNFILLHFTLKENLLAYLTLHQADVVVLTRDFPVTAEEIGQNVIVLYYSEHWPVNDCEVFQFKSIQEVLNEIEQKYFEKLRIKKSVVQVHTANSAPISYVEKADVQWEKVPDLKLEENIMKDSPDGNTFYGKEHSPQILDPSPTRKIQVLTFTSMRGGSGVTTAAMALAFHLSQKNIPVAYLDLSFPGCYEGFGTAGEDLENNWEKLKIPNIAIEDILSDLLKEDSTGVLRAACGNSCVRNYLAGDLLKKLLTLWEMENCCACVIIDLAVGLDEVAQCVWNLSDQIIWVCDGTAESLKKYEAGEKFIEDWKQRLLQIPEERVLYNRYGCDGKELKDSYGQVIGGIMLESQDNGVLSIAHKISRMRLFDWILR